MGHQIDFLLFLDSGQAPPDILNFGIKKSDSRIPETPVTQEKVENLSSFFTYGHTSIGTPDQI